MLNGGQHDMAALGLGAQGQAFESPVVGFGAAGNEIDLLGLGAEKSADAFARFGRRILGGLAVAVQTLGVAEALPENGSIASSTSGWTAEAAIWSR